MATSHSQGPSEFDVGEHTRMWSDFTRFTTYAVVGVAATLVLLAIFLL